MTEVRTFGPILGAGTQVNERTGQEEVKKGKLGTTVFVGPFPRGTEGDITIVPGRRAFDRKIGDILDAAEYATPSFADLNTALCARQFLDRAKGAGSLVCLRVVPTTNDVTNDDRPSKSIMDIFNRESQPKVIGSIEANNGSSFFGKRKVFLGSLSGVPGTDFPAVNQVQIDGVAAKTLKRDEFRNGTLILDGIPDTTYRIVTNSSDGLITLEADQDVITDWGDGETHGSTPSSAGPFNFGTVATPYNILVDSDRGGPVLVIFAVTAGTVGGDDVPVFLARNTDIVFTVNGVDYTVTFTGAELDIDDYLDTINGQLPGCSASNVAGNVVVSTDRKGSAATVVINDAESDGDMVTEVFGAAAPTETAGTGEVANHFAATAAEVSAYLDFSLAGIADAIDDGDGSFTLQTETSGAVGWVRVASGNLRALFGFDTDQYFGSDGPSDLDVTLVRSNVNVRGATKSLDIQFVDGSLRRDVEFGLVAFLNGRKVLSYPNLSMRLDSANYWSSVINNDPNNDLIVVTDTFTGDRTVGTARPANHFGASRTLTATRLTIANPHVSSLVGDWVPTLTWNSWGSAARVQRLRVTMTSATDFTVTTDQGTRTWDGELGVALDMGDYVGSITVATSAGIPEAGDRFDIYLKPLALNEAVGGNVFPNLTDVGQSGQSFRIIANGVDYVDVSALEDLTDAGNNIAGRDYRIEYRQQMERGYDGYLAGLTTGDYEQLLDASTTPLRKLRGRGYGLVKIAAPGIAYLSPALNVQRKIRDLAYEFNWMGKVEIPWLLHDWDVYYENDLVDALNMAMEREDFPMKSMYVSTHFPSFVYVADPFSEDVAGANKVLVPAIGLVLGEESRIAVAYKNYHKAPAGTKAQLPEVLELPVIGRSSMPVPLDEEILNNSGVNLIKWRNGGNVAILWGDRTLSTSKTFKFYHKRTLLSQYEIDLLEGFDFSIFEINDPEQDADVLAALHDYFLVEWRPKRAIRGTTFVGGSNPAAIFKMDADNNTDATRAEGDQICEISLRLADTVERLRFFVGAMGVTEAVG